MRKGTHKLIIEIEQADVKDVKAMIQHRYGLKLKPGIERLINQSLLRYRSTQMELFITNKKPKK